MSKQRELPGIRTRPTSADIKALVKSRLLDFELWRQERARRRAGGGAAAESQPSQQELFPSPPAPPDGTP